MQFEVLYNCQMRLEAMGPQAVRAAARGKPQLLPPQLHPATRANKRAGVAFRAARQHHNGQLTPRSRLSCGQHGGPR
jgi:hypothetical protein